MATFAFPIVSDAARLLNVIGYRLQQPCGPQATLETANPKRAFTTVDSGFPLAELEKALQTGKPFVYPFSSTQLPVLFDAGVWMENDRNKNHKDLLDALLGDPGPAAPLLGAGSNRRRNAVRPAG